MTTQNCKSFHENGTDFSEQELQSLLQNDGITLKQTTVINPRANAIVKIIHLTMGDILRTTDFKGFHWKNKLLYCYRLFHGILGVD